MQPIRFKPILKSTIWGGTRILSLKGITTPPSRRRMVGSETIGESWEISGVKDQESVVADGLYAGMTLSFLVHHFGAKLVGKECYKRFGDTFPLLIKFIDAHDYLSIQVHPDDEKAHRRGLPCGKTEMWYIMESDKDASLLCGLKEQITPEDYEQLVKENKIVDALACYPVSEGDVFYLPAGRIHAIGPGCMLAEIQQASDVTYRIYDYDRRDKDGFRRQLHTKQAAECIDYNVSDDYRTHYIPQKNGRSTLVECPYFKTSLIDLDTTVAVDYSTLDSFVILMCTKGSLSLTDNEGNTTSLRAGETILVPATTQSLSVEGNGTFLEITL